MRLSYLFLSTIAPILSFAASNPQNAGRAQMFMRSSSAFDVYTDNPSSSTKSWLNSHFWRFQTYSPYFDSRLSWLPNTWAYMDLYGIPTNSSLVSQHPEWILHDGSGKRLYIPFGCSGGTCPNYAGDVTNSGFRSWWISQAKSIFSQGYKGFWIDDVNMEFRVGNGSGTQVAPHDPNTGTTMTYDNWRLYIAEFTEQIRSALPTAEIVHNAIWFASPTRYSDQYVIREIKAANYINCERGVSDPGLVGGTGSWSVRAFLNYIDAVHSYGTNVVLDEYDFNGDYGLAGYYLISNGDDALGNQQLTPNNWWSGYGENLGTPLGARYDWNGLIRRDFLDGMVLLNPPQTVAISVTLPLPLTKVDDGKTATSVTLQPGQGLVLAGPMQAPAYSVTATPSTRSITAGSSTTYAVSIGVTGSLTGALSLAATGLPSGATASFSPASLAGSGSSTLSIATSLSTPAGTYSVTVVASSGSLQHTAKVGLTVEPVPVNLSSSYSRSGVYPDGTPFSTGGLDMNGFAYSANLLGTTYTSQGVKYNFGPAGGRNIATGATIPLPAGNFSVVHLLGTAVNGNQPSQQFKIKYSDGTTSLFVQGLSDWSAANGFAGETTAMAMPYRNTYSGAKNNHTFNVYSYSFAINKSKTVTSLSLPSNGNVLILAVTVTP